MDDRELIQSFVRQHSQEAFGQLVQRHKDWLYSACLRRLRDPSLAEDATQAVFVALARKAPRLANVTALSPWLHQAAKYASANIQRTRHRRAQYESEAAAMIRAKSKPEPESNWEDVAGELEPALDRLRLSDRQTILLRFYEQKTHEQIAAILDITEDAAKKRLSRAIDRLRAVLARRGVVVGASCLSGLLLTHVSSSAPTALAASVTALVGTPSHGQLAILSKQLVGWLTAMKAQTVAAVAVILLVAPVPLLVMKLQSPTNAQTQPVAPASPQIQAIAPSSQPVANQNPAPMAPGTYPLANVIFSENAPAGTKLVSGIDPKTIRVPGGAPAGYINSSAALKTSVSRATVFPAWSYRGRRVRLSGWIKTRGLENWAGLILVVVGPDSKIYAASNMGPNPIAGTTDWTSYSQVVDVPADSDHLYVATQVYGKGEVWTDGLQIEIVPSNIAITDDQIWHRWSMVAPRYDSRLDMDTLHDDRPMMCIESRETAGMSDWVCYDHYDRSIDRFRGHKVRMTAWMKSQDVLGNAGMWIRVVGADGKYIAGEVAPARRPVHGTTEWTKYSIQSQVPMEAMGIGTGFVMDGIGRIWVDLEKVEVDLID